MDEQKKFIVDVGVGKQVEEYLKHQMFDVKSVRDINVSLADNEILEIAIKEKRMIITMDKDFGELVYHTGLLHNGVLILRLEDADEDEKVKIVSQIMNSYVNEIYTKFCVYQNGKLRIKTR